MQIALLAFALAAANPADVDEYIKVSGMTAQLSQTPQMVVAGFDDAVAKNGTQVNAELLAGLRGAMSDVYAADRVMAAIRAQLLKTADQAALRKTLDFYKTPLAVKVTELEVAVSTVEGMTEIQRYAGTLQANPPAPERLKLVTELDRAIRGTESGLDLMAGTVRGMMSAMRAILPKEKQLDGKQLAKVLADVRAKNRPGMQQMTLASSLYTYRSLSDSELSQYVAFWASPPGAAMGAKTTAAINAAFDKLAVELGDAAAALTVRYPAKK